MKITKLEVRNYRTLERVDLTFPTSYTAICGANDSGKTNVVRILRVLMREEPSPFSPFEDEQELSIDDDFPKWKEPEQGEKRIQIAVTIEAHPDRDSGLYQFIIRQLSLEDTGEPLSFRLSVSSSSANPAQEVKVDTAGQTFEGLPAQDVLNRIQTSKSILIHNSTQPDPRLRFSGGLGHLRELSAENAPILETMQKSVDRNLEKIAKGHQKELEELLGRLEKKYRVRLSLPTYNLSYLPFRLTLGERKYAVPLDSWGSGTQNRTLTLLTLFRAKQIADAQSTSAQKVTPVIIVEEPESFLHPAAQAEFGRILDDLAQEFQVQVIVTTHSPYMLSIDSPASNILLQRRAYYTQLLETLVVDTSGDNWMKPFGLALGLESEEFKPWKDLFLTPGQAILLVEGSTDKEYFDLLRDPVHGAGQLKFDGEIVPYDGTGSLKNTVLLRFIMNRYKKIFVTYDLDADNDLAKSLKSLGLERNKQYCPIGLNAAGKKNIEGLLPDSVREKVYGQNPDLVQAAMSGTVDEQKSAKSRLKNLLLEEFKATAKPGDQYYKGFYAVTKLANKALC